MTTGTPAGGVSAESGPGLAAFQAEVARLFFGLPESRGFLLAGGAALLADPRDPATIEEALARILDDPALADDLAARGRSRAAELTWEAAAEATAAAYAEAVQ